MIRPRTALLAILLLVARGTVSAGPPTRGADAAGTALVRVVRRTVVEVVGLPGRRGRTATSAGVAVGGGLVLSWSRRDVDAGRSVRVLGRQGEAVEAEVVARDPESGVVAIRPRTPISSFLEPGGDLGAGAPVVSGGFPFGTQRGDGAAAASLGIVAQVRRRGEGPGLARYVLSTSVNPGEFGGPLVDRYGRLAGILLSDRERSSGLSTAVPLSTLRETFKAHAEVHAALAPGSDPAPPDQTAWPAHDRLVEVARAVEPAVVSISAKNEAPGRFDRHLTGLLIDEQGHVLTTRSAVEREGEIRVFLRDGRDLPAVRLGVDERLDLALLRVHDERPIPFAPLAGGASPRVGAFVLAVGNPAGPDRATGPLLTMGIVGAVDRNSNRRFGALHTDAAVNRANEGGPLLDIEGRVIGILSTIGGTALVRTGANSGIGFAIPSELILPRLDELRRGRSLEYRPGYLGIILSRDPAAGGGVRIDSVVPGFPAEKAGVKPGDVIVAANGVSLDDFEALRKTFMDFVEGQRIRLSLRRGEKFVEADPALVKWPAGGPR